MMEILDAVWDGFLIGFKSVGLVGGLIVGAYTAFLLTNATWRILERITER